MVEYAEVFKCAFLLLGLLAVASSRGSGRQGALSIKHHRNKNSTKSNEVLTSDFNEPEPIENGATETETDWGDAEALDSLPTMQQKPEPTSEILSMLQMMTDEIAGLRGQMSTLKFQNHLIYKQLKKTAYRCNSPVSQTYPIKSAAMMAEPKKTCPPGFTENQDTHTCYKFATDRITWRMAREKCRAQDSDLVSITSNREQRYIAEQARKHAGTRHCDFWAGATDQGSEGQWYWVSNKRPLSYNNWNHNEPNNGNGDEHCMHMLWVFNWAWNDARCNWDNACYICEVKLN